MSNKDEIMTILEKEALTFAVSLSWDTMIVPVKPHFMSLSLNHKVIYLQYAVHQFKKKGSKYLRNTISMVFCQSVVNNVSKTVYEHKLNNHCSLLIWLR